MGFIFTVLFIIAVLVISWLIEYWWVLLIALCFAAVVGVVLLVSNHREKQKIVGTEKYTIIKEVNLYEERLEPAWEYPNPDDQWLFAEEVNEYVGTEYDVLYVYDDNTYREVCGLKSVPKEALKIARDDLSYDDTKSNLKNRCF